MPNALIVLDKDTVDEIETQLGRKPWKKGEHRIDEATGEMEFFDGTTWQKYAYPSSPAAGDIIRRNSANTAWERLAVGTDGQFLRVVGGLPSWPVHTLMAFSVANGTNTAIAAVGDNQAFMTNGTSFTSRVFPTWLVQISSADNAEIIWAGEMHNPAHGILDSFDFRFPASGAGTLHKITTTLIGFEFPGTTGSYHLNTTSITLNGGSVTVLMRYINGQLLS